MTEETLLGWRHRRFDLGLISLPVPEENLMIMPLFDEELLIVRPSSTKVHGSQKVGTIRAAELARAQFLLYPKNSVLRAVISS